MYTHQYMTATKYGPQTLRYLCFGVLEEKFAVEKFLLWDKTKILSTHDPQYQ